MSGYCDSDWVEIDCNWLNIHYLYSGVAIYNLDLVRWSRRSNLFDRRFIRDL